MPHVVDAYNVIFRDEELSNIADESLERARDVLISLLRKLARAGRKVVAVFDGAEGAFGWGRRRTVKGVKVIFSEPKGTADAEIERVISSTPPASNWRVVTDDKKLARRARSLGAKTVPTKEFLQKLRKKVRRPAGRRSLSPGEVDYWMRVFGAEE